MVAAKLSPMDRFQATSTPAHFAMLASRGRWKLARHLSLLNRYLLACAARSITRLIVTMPPRHGKSSFISRYFPAWWLGNFPHQRVALVSYGDSLAHKWGGQAREAFDTWGPALFGRRSMGRSRAADDWNIERCEGGMQSLGIGGPINGRGADLLILDDMYKNAQQGESPAYREYVWDWFMSTGRTRLEPGGVLIMFMTRWHEDDICGRVIEQMRSGGEHYTILNLPAIAETDEPHFPIGMGRKVGEALWPERYPLYHNGRPGCIPLDSIRNGMTARWWAALFQQRPTPEGGGLFNRDDFKIVTDYPGFLQSVRFWDMAATENTGSNNPDWTAGALLSLGIDQRYYLRDMQRLQGRPGATEKRILQTCKTDGPMVPFCMEEEGGSAGKIVSHNWRNTLRDNRMEQYIFRPVRSTGSKKDRAMPVAQRAEHDGFRVLNTGRYDIHSLLHEIEMFPNGKNDDQVDAISGAFGQLMNRPANAPVYSGGYSDHLGDYSPQ